MIPALYNKLGTTKIGDLVDTVEAYVTEERNGEFEIELTYPATYPFSSDLVEENIIVADGNDTLKAQKFRIYMVKKFMSSKITVFARHISFDLAYDYIDSINITNQSCEYCLNQLFRSSQFSTQYRGYSDIINAQNYKISKVNVLAAIGGSQGSIIDTFGTGAEIKRDNTNIHVLNSRGHDNGVTIEYKKNLTGFELEEDNTDLATRIQGYATYTPEGGEETLIETGWIDSPLINNYSHPYCQRIDFSEFYQDGEVPTVANLTTRVNRKYSTDKVDIPKTNYKIEFIPLSKAGVTINDNITLCDKVTIIDSRYGVNTQAKVIKVVYDVLRERYDSMELGEPKTRLTDVIGGGSGEDGKPGPPGKDGTSIRILGSYNSYEELIAAHPNNNQNGDAYIVQGDLYVWDGNQFKNVGKFQGQDGIDGSDGVDGQDGVSIIWKGTFSSHPANPQNGWAYYNSTDKKSYVYQSGTWYQMSIDGTDGSDGVNGEDGISIIWKGELKDPPANPQKNWCYRDIDNGVIYIYNGTAWEVMVLDGTDGADGTNGTDGMSVFITYHDSLTIPTKPTGNGTTGGWHTNATSAVVWMSQKVAINSTSGTWGEPIKIKGQDGSDGETGPPGPPGEEFPDTLPHVPRVTTKVYGFGSIEINWTFENKVYYTYEVYASKTNNFIPNAMDLIHEGQTSSFLFQAKPNETWYFKVCGKNSYGRRTGFSTQVSATTPIVEDLSDYVAKMAIGDALIGTLNLERGWVGQLKGNWIDAKQLTVTDGNGKRTLDIDSYGNINLQPSLLKILLENSNVGVTINGVGLIVDNGAIKIRNKEGNEVICGDVDGNIVVKSSNGTEIVKLSDEGITTSNGSIIVKNAPTCSYNTNARLQLNGGNVMIFNPSRREEGNVNELTDTAYYGAFEQWIMTEEVYVADLIRRSKLFTGGTKVELYEKKLVNGRFVENTATLTAGRLTVNEVVANNSHVVESGANSYGSYVKFYDGTQICCITKWIGTVACTQSAGGTNIYVKDEATNNPYYAFPSGFAGTANVEVSVESDGYLCSCIGQRTSTMAQVRFWSPISRTANGVCVHMKVIGRWK